MDVKEERRKKDRERYAWMTDEEKQEKLKKRREAYQQKKKLEEAKKQSMPSKDSIASEPNICHNRTSRCFYLK
jgi:hypothetical protein